MASAIDCYFVNDSHRGRIPIWRLPMEAVIPNFHLPMRRYESLRLITAIKTPYLSDDRFDLMAYDALMNEQINDGVEGVCDHWRHDWRGPVYEMSWDEHIMLIGHTMNCYVQDIPHVIEKIAKSPNMAGVKECVRHDIVEQWVCRVECKQR
ncbi:hypothetical protein SASPL_138164 [Salvia splendens]|uniref:Uncharacterized protein n=1 Tax=Salvia splendens TaxID=180675 RepID=A0A8X8ZE25_SALSN|nr:hypothetical protein SASPL_138164 [Salvia splendens]